eukprot:749225-Hanusia_phi.AAC.2
MEIRKGIFGYAIRCSHAISVFSWRSIRSCEELFPFRKGSLLCLNWYLGIFLFQRLTSSQGRGLFVREDPAERPEHDATSEGVQEKK